MIHVVFVADNVVVETGLPMEIDMGKTAVNCFGGSALEMIDN